jgi:tetratricopeptide (TPR) repeat protein
MPETPSELQNELETLERKHADDPAGRFFVPLANSYRQLGQLDRAEALLRDGLRAHPEYLSAHIVLGRCLADRQRVEEAVGEFRYVLSLDPQNLIALRTLGELAAGEGDRQEAERWYEELLAVDPMNEEARRALESLASPGPAAATTEPEIDPLAGWTEEDGPPSWEGGAWESWPAFTEEDPGLEDRVPRPVEQDLEFEALYARMVEIDDQPAVEIEPVSPAAPHLFDLDDDRAGDAGAAGPEVVTETIAELYARQGLPERAAEVYRELIRRRGGDPALELRLRELERGAALADAAGEEIPAAAVEAGLGLAPLEPAEPGPDDAEGGADLFADSVAAGFEAGWPEDLPEAAEPAATLPQLHAMPDRPGEEPEPPARTIGGELRELLAWRPAGGPVPAGPVDAEPEQATPATAAAGYDAEPDDPEPAAWTPPPATAAADGGKVPAEEELFPWELPEPEPGPEQPAAAAEEIRPEPRLPAADAAAHEPPARPRQEPAPSRAEDDDDLESFQEWLRSLRR